MSAKRYLLERYVMRQVTVGMGAALLLLAAVTLLLSVLDELNGAVGLARATWYALLGVPRRVHELTPFAAMIGALAGLSSLASNAELTAARAAGASVYRLAGAALLPALVLALASGVLAETLAPWGERAAEVARAVNRDGGADLGRGYWYRDGNAFVAVDAVAADGSLRGMTTFRFAAAGRRVEMQFAQRARFDPRAGWRLEDVRATAIDGDRVSATRYANRLWPSAVTPALLSTRVLIGVNKLSIRQLAEQVSYMRREGLDAGRYELALWRKLTQPLAMLALVVLATSFVFGPLRSAGLGLRLTVGALAGLAFKYLQDLAAPLGLLLGASAALAALLPVVVTLLSGAWLLKRAA